MKKLYILPILCVSWVHADLSMNQIRDMVTKIHQKREGIKLETLENTKEPFVRTQKEDNVTTLVIPTQEKETKLALHAILNKKAYINDTWESVGNVIGGYTLKYIGKRGVVLRNENQIKKLFLHKERDNFITIKGRE